MAKRPSLQFYPGDWLRDTALRSCSLAARGLWAEMLWLMHDGNPYGTLKVGKKVILPANLARMVGSTLEETESLLRELSDAEVYSVDEDGAIYSRRMRRDEEVRQKRAAGGKLGGNPALMVGREVPEKVNLPANLQPTPASSSASAEKKKDKAPSEPPAGRPLNEQALRIQRMEERFRAGGVTPPKPALIALWLKTLRSEERMLAFLDDMAHRGKLGVLEYCGRVVQDWAPSKSRAPAAQDNRSREERRLAEQNAAIMAPVPRQAAIDVRARLEALAARIPPALSVHASAVLALDGDAGDVEARLQRIDGLILRDLPGFLGPEVMAEISGKRDAHVSRLRSRMGPDQLATAGREILEKLMRDRAGLPELSLFAPDG